MRDESSKSFAVNGLVDVTGFEPAIPCLQSTRADSNPSILNF
jgi:hypothetical protein